MDKQRRRELKKLGAAKVRQASAETRAALDARNPFPVGDPSWVENLKTEYRLNREFRANSTRVLRDQEVRKQAEIRKRSIDLFEDGQMFPRPGWYLQCGRCLDLVPTHCTVALQCACGAVVVDPGKGVCAVPRGEYAVVEPVGRGDLRPESSPGPWWKFWQGRKPFRWSALVPAGLRGRAREQPEARPVEPAPIRPLRLEAKAAPAAAKAAQSAAKRITFPYPCEVSAGAVAVQRLEALRAGGQGIPVILGGKAAFERVAECQGLHGSTPEELLARAAALDPLAWLAQREQEDAESFEIEEAGWPEHAEVNTALSAHLDIRTRKPLDEVYIAILPARHAWEAACYLKIGGWNAVPEAHEHSALWRYWEERHGARVACIADDVIEFTVERPPRTREEALALARQHYVYCADIVHQGVGSVEALAATLLEAPVWYFWWD